MTDEELLQELIQRGLIDQAGANGLKRDRALGERSLEELIYERRLVEDANVAEAKAKLLNIPYKKVRIETIDAALLALISEGMVRTYGVVPISKSADMLVVGMLHPEDQKAQEALRFLARQHGMDLGVYVISFGDWQEVLNKYSPFKSDVAAALKALNLGPGGSALKSVGLDETTKAAGEEAPIIKIVADTLREAVHGRASDVHFEPQEKHLRIRFRVDGDLKEIATLPVQISQAIASRIKVMSNLKIDETRIPQDGRFRARLLEREIDFRISTFPTPLGEKVAVRVLDPTSGVRKFSELALNDKNRERVKRGLAKPFGMILLTGPTGSGKTTALYAFLQELNREEVNIVSLEDPVEYFIPGINQSQVHPEIGYDFASGLRQILRQDPDVIMVGEIRDTETASLAVQAALTGHIVLATLHTNNAAGVIPRLLDMHVESFLLPAALNLMISQRLVGLLCQSCRKEKEAPEVMARMINRALAELPHGMAVPYKEPYTVYTSPGCPKCKNSGISGRIGVFEVLEMTPELEEVVYSGPTLQKIAKEAKRQEMITLRQDGVLKALEGLVSMEEVIRGTEETSEKT